MARLTKLQRREIESALAFIERGLGDLTSPRYVLTTKDWKATTAAHYVATGDYGRERYGEALNPVQWHGSGHTIAGNAIHVLKRVLDADDRLKGNS